MTMAPRDCHPEYSIKAAAQATGLSVETLRAWERRYRIVEPKRDDDGHRIYSAEDVARLTRLRAATARGHSIGKLAHLSEAELDGLLAEPAAAGPNATAARTLSDRILSGIEKYDIEECDQAIAMAFALMPVADVVCDVLSPVLQEVGERWYQGIFTVGQERLVSSSLRRQISALLNTYNGVAKGPTIVFATFSGEPHELGILMYAAMAASRKLRACYLGADMPPDEISNFAARVHAAAVAVSLVLPENSPAAIQQLAALRSGLPDDVEIWIGGAGAQAVEAARLPAGSVRMSGRADFEHRLDLLATAPR